jgi:hypothetical protein
MTHRESNGPPTWEFVPVCPVCLARDRVIFAVNDDGSDATLGGCMRCAIIWEEADRVPIPLRRNAEQN